MRKAAALYLEFSTPLQSWNNFEQLHQNFLCCNLTCCQFIAGVGAAFVTIATHSVLVKYFPGKQLVPVAANVLFFSISCIMFPLLIGW